jgi:hypothetical protein
VTKYSNKWYTFDVVEVATLDALKSKDKKVTALKEAKAKLEERFKTGNAFPP